MAIPTTTAELLEALKGLQGSSAEDAAERKNYRYVIYVRKSTDDKDKQVRSLGDQIILCKQFAKDIGAGDPDVVQESESAKESNKRPKFRQMLLDITNGKYDGIIAWHPDRLARNMKDAGEVIDLLDKRIIRDLKFVSFSFENTTSGKMLLGITFVLSKQYSDQLGDNVSRGNRMSTEEGRYVGKAKHGYRKDAGQFLRPDGENFDLIEKAFQMRVDGKTLKAIGQYLNAHHYTRWQPDGSHAKFTWNVQKVKMIICDPAYTGVIVHGKRSGRVDLTKKYDFKPAVSVENFMKINKIENGNQFIKLARHYHRGEDVKADLMRGMVFCADCEEAMSTGITSKKNSKKGLTRYFYYRCETHGCPRHKKSVRAKIIMDFIKGFLAEKPFSSKGSYDHYVEEIKKVSAERERNDRMSLVTLKSHKRRLEDRFVKIKELLIDTKDEKIKETFAADLADAERDIAVADGEIKKAQKIAEANKLTPLTYEKFLELMEQVPKILASIKKMKELDYIIKKVFSNFSVRGKKVENATLNKPFDELYAKNVHDSGGGRIRTMWVAPPPSTLIFLDFSRPTPTYNKSV